MQVAGVIVSIAVAMGAQPVTSEWADNDPARPVIVATAPALADQVEAAAHRCGLHNLQRVMRSGLAWVIMRDVLARDSESRVEIRCLRNWAMAHPEIRLYFFGRPTREDGSL